MAIHIDDIETDESRLRGIGETMIAVRDLGTILNQAALERTQDHWRIVLCLLTIQYPLLVVRVVFTVGPVD